MPDQDQNCTAKSFSCVWVFLQLETLIQESGALLQNTLHSFLRSLQYATNCSLTKQMCHMPIKLENDKKLHRKRRAFLFVCMPPAPSLDNYFSSGTFIAFYKN